MAVRQVNAVSAVVNNSIKGNDNEMIELTINRWNGSHQPHRRVPPLGSRICFCGDRCHHFHQLFFAYFAWSSFPSGSKSLFICDSAPSLQACGFVRRISRSRLFSRLRAYYAIFNQCSRSDCQSRSPSSPRRSARCRHAAGHSNCARSHCRQATSPRVRTDGNSQAERATSSRDGELRIY